MLRRTHLLLAVTLGLGAVGAASPIPAPSPPDQMSPSPPGPSDQMSPSPTSPPASPGAVVGAVIKDAQGNPVGLMDIDTRPGGKTRIRVAVRNLPPGYHGFHIHTVGTCDPNSTDPATGSPFFSAGPHFNLGSGSHPNHSGDLPSLLVGEDGTGRAAAFTDRFQVKQLFDEDGSSIVIHALPDNDSNIPDRYKGTRGEAGPDADTLKTGDSGKRIACGVITRR
ncbi:superoxide dismutase family protein [Streptosporangium sp. NPDC000396]|uniref:superoxide dismutase family protein n=1 Tax=Streptosporangium sp. NPDC000396 TaxID=3366185 RepID=UPI0036954A17